MKASDPGPIILLHFNRRSQRFCGFFADSRLVDGSNVHAVYVNVISVSGSTHIDNVAAAGTLPIFSKQPAMWPTNPGRTRVFEFVSLAVYAAWILFVTIRHEPWRDECDPWLAARDMSLRQLFSWLGAAGTPGLWYLLIMPLAKAGLPIVTMSVLHDIIAIKTAGLILFRSPFDRVSKLLLIFSYYFAYEYAVVARTYALDTLLIFGIVVILRKKQPSILGGVLIALLANCNAHGFFISGTFSLVLAVRWIRQEGLTRRIAAIAGIIAAGLGLAFVQLLPPAWAQHIGGATHWSSAWVAMQKACFPRFPAKPWSPGWIPSLIPFSSAFYIFRTAVSLVYFGATFWLLARRDRFSFWMIAFACLSLLWIFVFKYFSFEHHAGLLFVLGIAALWLAKAAGAAQHPGFERTLERSAQICLATVLVIAFIQGIVWSANDLAFPYSTGPRMAAFIRNNGLEKRTIAVFPDEFAAPVLPHLNRSTRFWMVGRQDYGTYMTWDSAWASNSGMKDPAVIARVARQFPNHTCLLLMARRPLVDPSAAGYRLLYSSSADYWIEIPEQYFLYEPVR